MTLRGVILDVAAEHLNEIIRFEEIIMDQNFTVIDIVANQMLDE